MVVEVMPRPPQCRGAVLTDQSRGRQYEDARSSYWWRTFPGLASRLQPRCPASPIHYQHDPVDTTKTSVVGAINTLDHMLRTFHHTAQHRMTDLCKIVTKNKSDKFGSRHNYTALYDHLFRGSCKSVKTLLEIGIGSLSVSVNSNMRFHTPWVYRIATRLIPTRLVNEVVHSLYGEKNFPIYQPGASLRSWREYFPNAQIFGADVDRSILFNSDRINCCWVDQEKSKKRIRKSF